MGVMNKEVNIEMTLGDCDIGDRITDTVYILIKNLNFFFYCNKYKADLPALKKLIKDCVNGLHHLHSKNLYHHDIKPGNIIYKESTGTHMLTDYGLVRKFTI